MILHPRDERWRWRLWRGASEGHRKRNRAGNERELERRGERGERESGKREGKRVRGKK